MIHVANAMAPTNGSHYTWLIINCTKAMDVMEFCGRAMYQMHVDIVVAQLPILLNAVNYNVNINN